MAQGKHTCKILKEIRRQIAEANGIGFATSECRYKGDCLGTCPKCEAEVRYLEQQLRARSLAGKAVVLAGISAASLAMLMPMTSQAQCVQEPQNSLNESIPVMTDTITVRGVVLSGDTLSDGTISKEPLIGATILNRRTKSGTMTDIDGHFGLSARVGDILEVKYVGYEPQTIVVTDHMDNIEVFFTTPTTIMGVVVAEKEPAVLLEEKYYLDLNVIDENGNPIDTDALYIESPRIYANGQEDIYYIHPEFIDDKHPCRIYWDAAMRDEVGFPLKEATLRIEAEGYDDPVTIKVKYPKRNARKTIKFKHKKK